MITMDAWRERVRGWLSREPIVRAVLGGGLTLVVILLYLAGAFEWLELRTYDWRYALLPAEKLESPISLVAIDQETETHFNVRATDISRSIFASAVRNLAEAGARLVVFDLTLSKPRDVRGDAELAQAVAEAGNVVLARFIGERFHNIPMAMFREAELGEGLINLVLDKDGILRSIPLVGLDYTADEAEPEPVLALSLEMARQYLDPNGEHEVDLSLPDELDVAQLKIPYPDGRMRVHYYGPPFTFPRMPLWKAATGEFDPAEIQGRIVLIGPAVPTLHDRYPTPYTERRERGLTGETDRSRAPMDGFEIHANALQTILDRKFVHRSKDRWGLVPFLLAVIGIVGSVLLIQTRSSSLVVEVFRVLLIVGIGLVGYVLFWKWHYWLDIVPMYSLVAFQYSAAVSYQRYLERQKRRQVQAMFGRYVSAQVVEQLVKNPDMANPSGRKERLTMFFSDVRGFTSMSEKMEPQHVQQLLSEYFTEMTRILFKHGGTLDKFMGDAVMAFFGNPEPQPDHARRAVFMALEMQEAVTQLNQKWAAQGRRTIGVGMGINTGEVTVGNLGSKDFLDYTVIGDAVNLACRLEENAKAGDIIITQSTFDEVKDVIEAQPMEPMRVKGKADPIAIYRVLGRTKQGGVPQWNQQSEALAQASRAS